MQTYKIRHSGVWYRFKKQNSVALKDYALFGSCPLAVRGIRENDDIDVIVTPRLWNRLSEEHPNDGSHISLDPLNIYREWGSLDIEKEIWQGDIIRWDNWVRLDTVVDWKRVRNLPKDQEDLRLIRDYLK